MAGTPNRIATDGKAGRATLRQRLPALLLALLGTLLTVGAYLQAHRQMAHLESAELERRATEYAAEIQHTLNMNLEILDGVGALFDASREVSRTEFEAYGRYALAHHGELQALEWAPRVPATYRANYEAAARTEGLEGFRIVERTPDGGLQPAGDRTEYFPVFYRFPDSDAESPYGLDLGSDLRHRPIIEQARERGGTVAAVLRHAVGAARDGRLLIVLPVYRTSRSGQEPDGPLTNTPPYGFVIAIIRIREMIDTALGLFPADELNLRLDDSGHGNETPASLYVNDTDYLPGADDLRFDIELPGNSWVLSIAPGPALGAGHHHQWPLLLLVFGLVFTFSFTAYLDTMRRRSVTLGTMNRALAESRDRIEQAHREWVEAFDAVPDPIFVHDSEGRLVRANRAYTEAAGLPFKEMLGRPYWEVFPRGDGPFPGCSLHDEDSEEPYEMTLAGRHYTTRSFRLHHGEDRPRSGIHILQDITARRESQAREHALLEVLSERVKEIDCLYQVTRLAADTEQPLEQVLQRVADTLPGGWQYPDKAAARVRLGESNLTSRNYRPTEWTLQAPIPLPDPPDGEVELCYLEPLPKADHGPFLDEELALIESVGVQLGQLIAQRRHAESLHRLNRTLRTLSQSNTALVRAGSEVELNQSLCDVMARQGGYPLVWVAYRDDRPAAGMQIRAVAGTLSTQDQLLRRAATINTGAPANLEPGTSEGDRSCVVLPLAEAERVFGVLGVCAAPQQEFTTEEVALLEELANDLAFGIRSHRTSDERDRAREALGKVLFQTIEAISRTVEIRDPYTAGHQRRVALLAEAIARALGWGEDRIEGLRLGAIIHDIGKIYVPAEILNRPGRLTPQEFGIIQQHPQVGHDIVRGISFPWPVAEMILQHHERLDGSGYPNGLAGDAIVEEARILAVADVVEAISAHRPYRPALGPEKALAEIRSGRGGRYDADIVDTCVGLFEEARFQWPDETGPGSY
jgi:putative nucleotidyltransferase with HDIG domain/PAS domain S-box-containing protein